VAHGRGLAGAGVADENAETWLIGQPAEEALRAPMVFSQSGSWSGSSSTNSTSKPREMW
jgi:hypothetical protein